MNKQELIESIKKAEKLIIDESIINGSVIEFIKSDTVIELVSQVDEPEKVKIPQFVANWIGNVKRNGIKRKNNFGFYEEITFNDSVYRVMYYIFKDGIATEDVKRWVGDNPDDFARAWLDGYEIEKPKYVVTDGNHLYFKKYQEDIEIVILADEQPGTMAYVKKFDTEEEAQKAADILGWKVEEVQDD